MGQGWNMKEMVKILNVEIVDGRHYQPHWKKELQLIETDKGDFFDVLVYDGGYNWEDHIGENMEVQITNSEYYEWITPIGSTRKSYLQMKFSTEKTTIKPLEENDILKPIEINGIKFRLPSENEKIQDYVQELMNKLILNNLIPKVELLRLVTDYNYCYETFGTGWNNGDTTSKYTLLKPYDGSKLQGYYVRDFNGYYLCSLWSQNNKYKFVNWLYKVSKMKTNYEEIDEINTELKTEYYKFINRLSYDISSPEKIKKRFGIIISTETLDKINIDFLEIFSFDEYQRLVSSTEEVNNILISKLNQEILKIENERKQLTEETPIEILFVKNVFSHKYGYHNFLQRKDKSNNYILAEKKGMKNERDLHTYINKEVKLLVYERDGDIIKSWEWENITRDDLIDEYNDTVNMMGNYLSSPEKIEEYFEITFPEILFQQIFMPSNIEPSSIVSHDEYINFGDTKDTRQHKMKMKIKQKLEEIIETIKQALLQGLYNNYIKQINDWLSSPEKIKEYLDISISSAIFDKLNINIQEIFSFDEYQRLESMSAEIKKILIEKFKQEILRQEYNLLIEEINHHLTSSEKVYEYFGVTFPENSLALVNIDITNLLPFDLYTTHPDRVRELTNIVKNELVKRLHKQCSKILIATRTYITKDEYDIYKIENGENILVDSKGLINCNELPEAHKKIRLYIYETKDNIITQWEWCEIKKIIIKKPHSPLHPKPKNQ